VTKGRLAWLACVGVLLTYILAYSAWNVTHGFISYYAAARLLLEGRLGAAAYDDAWFGKNVQDITGTGVLEIFTPNPPMMALMAVPVAWLDPQTARVIWLLASLGAAATVAFALLRQREKIDAPLSIAIGGVMLLNPAMFANLRIGQSYLFVFAMLGGAALSLIKGRDRLAGVLVGLAFALKSAGLPLLILLIWMRHWTAIKFAVATFAIAVALTAPFVEPAMWRRYPSAVAEFVERPASSTTAYQTTLSLFRRLCIADSKWNPHPAAQCAPVAYVAPGLLIISALAATLAAARRSPLSLWVAAGLCLSELSLPIAAEPHFMLFAAALALIPIGGVSLAVFAALYVIPLAYTAEVFTDGWRVVLAYPRLYAAWLLWAVSLAAMLAVRGGSGGEHRGR
jgi:glycosyl transferase family 87